MTRRHTPNPSWIKVIVDGKRITIPARVLYAFRESTKDGILPESRLTGLGSLAYIFTRRGWAIRSRGNYRLTEKGFKVREELRAFDKRKQQDLARQEEEK